MRFAYLWLVPVAFACGATLANQPTELSINAVAVTENGSPLAKGTLRVARDAKDIHAGRRGTEGQSPEPVPMYMLVSYVFAPTGGHLVVTPSTGDTWTETGDWGVNARTTVEGPETVLVPGGTFRETLKYKTVIAGAQTDPEPASAFVNGTRYLWLAKGVGLARLRYEHANGVITEAVLLSHAVSASEDYLPLCPGNRWTYAWKNDYRKEAVIETVTVAERPDEARQTPPSSWSSEPRKPRTAATDSGSVKLDLSVDTWLKIAPDAGTGFNFPYYLFVPQEVDPKANGHMLVEMNNTGTTSDDFQVHEEKAEALARDSYATRIARQLQTPLLVPVFPRPREQGQVYTHSLDEDTLRIASGPLKKIDLQLIAMIRDAQALLRRNNVKIQDQVFMHGFSASGVFTNRFAILHPEVVRAVAAGGINAIPTFPTARWHDIALPFPVGIADLQELTGSVFDEPGYKRVSQYIYMGYLDRNDTTLSRDAFCEEHAQLIRSLIGADMGDRWRVSQSIYRDLGIPAQCVTYNATTHEIKPEMIEDVVAFFRANAADGFVAITPHQYPFVDFVKVAHIKGLYWKGDERIPAFARNLFDGQGDFLIVVEEKMQGQMNVFQEKVAFEFVLTAPAQEDIHVTPEMSYGTCSSNDFCGFGVLLAPAESRKLVRGVPYSITPVHQGKEYYWQAREGVVLVKP